MAEPWARRPSETGKAFAAWVQYRDLGAHGRSLDKAARLVGKDRSLLARWSVLHQWQERANAYDTHVYREAQATQERERKQDDRKTPPQGRPAD